MTTQRELDRFLDRAYDRARARVMRGKTGSPTQADIKQIGREAIKIARQEIIAQVQTKIDNELQTFENDLLIRLNEWGTAVNLVTGQDIIFPEDTKFAACDGASATFIIEQKPQLRTIINQNYSRTVAKKPRLAFPYVIFGFHFLKSGSMVSMTCHCTNKPLLTLDDEIYHLTISNIYKEPFGTGVCRSYHSIDDENLPLHMRVSNYIAEFWQSGFFSAKSHAAVRTNDRRLATFEAWVKATEEDPRFILEIGWPKVNRAPKGSLTPRKLIQTLQASTRNDSRASQTKNVFRPYGQKLAGSIKDVILHTISPEDHKLSEEKKEERPEIDLKAAIKADTKNPMFVKNVGKPKLKRGQKSCPTCGRIYGVRQQMCICGWDFKNKIQIGEEKRAKAQKAIQRMLGRKVAQAPVRAAPRAKPVRQAPKPKPVAVANIIRKVRKRKTPKKVVPKEPGKGRKFCPDCYVTCGVRTYTCPNCGHQF